MDYSPILDFAICQLNPEKPSTKKMTHPVKISGNYRWRIVALLFFATTINYIDRQVIGILKPYISETLGWSEVDYGYIVMAFQVAYGLGLLTTGKLLDKYGTRLGYTVAIIIWSIAAIFHSAARSVWSFAAARFFLGLGESANFPAAVKTVAEWFPKKERALATGWFNMGSSVGAFLTPVLVSGIFITLGWQWAFIITGSLGFIWIILWLAFYYSPQVHPKLTPAEYEYIHSDNEGEKQNSVKWRKLFNYRQTYAISIARFLTDWAWWFILFWIPDYLNKAHHVNITGLVLPLIVIYSLAGLGGIAGGWFSSQLIKSGRSLDFSRKRAFLLCALIVMPVILLSQIHVLWVSVLLIAGAAFGHSAWASNIFTVVSDIYPKNAVGSMTGIAGFAASVGGILSAPVIGYLVSLTGGYVIVFLMAGCAYLTAWGLLKLMIPKIQPIVIT
jgi:ACS family hexuronate transporter-like MFS transporter